MISTEFYFEEVIIPNAAGVNFERWCLDAQLSGRQDFRGFCVLRGGNQIAESRLAVQAFKAVAMAIKTAVAALVTTTAWACKINP